MNLQCVVVVQMFQFGQTDIDKLLEEKELEFQAREREFQARERKLLSKLDEQKQKYTEEKLHSDEQVIRLQKSNEDMKYVMLYKYSVVWFYF